MFNIVSYDTESTVADFHNFSLILKRLGGGLFKRIKRAIFKHGGRWFGGKQPRVW